MFNLFGLLALKTIGMRVARTFIEVSNKIRFGCEATGLLNLTCVEVENSV